jgi:tRNA(Ile)-lysidine synthase
LTLLDAVSADGLLERGRPVLVMYSGGRDSTCLLDIAVRVVGRDHVGALHVNYGLRDSADEDEHHCVATCARLAIGLELRRPRRPQSGNLQAWARDQRYDAAREIAATRGADFAAGHTASDQVETILYRLASSPSRRALLGMRAREGRLVRPLLGFTREQTTAYCVERGLQWREDESNRSDAYARARVREALIPAFKAVHPAAEANILALAEVLRAESEVLDALVDRELGGGLEIDRERVTALPLPVARLVIQRLADRAAGGPAPGAARRAEEILALQSGALDLPHGVRAVVRQGMLHFERTPPLTPRLHIN